MRSREGSLRRVAALGCVAALAAGAVACGGDDESSSGGSSGGANKASAPGITATTVTVGGHFPLTGPAAPGYSEIPQAIDAYFKYVNANGGINGRKLKFISRDDGYNPTNTVKVTKQLVLQDKVFAIVGGLGTPTHTKVVDFLNSSRVPDLFVSSGCRCWDEPDKHPYTFGWQPDYVVEGKILGDYIKKNLAGKKVAYFFQDDDFGKDGVAGLDKYIKGQVVSRQSYQPGNTDIGPQMAAIKQSGAEVVAMFTIPAYTALAHLAAVKLGMKAQFVVSNVGSDPTTVGGLLKAFSKGKAGASLMDGMISDGYLPPLDDQSDSWAALFRKVHDTYIPKLPLDGNVNYGMALAYTFVTALQNAGQNPTRKDVVDAVEKGGLKGPTLVPYRYSADSHAGATGVQMAKIADGKVELMGDPVTTDDEGGAIEPSSQESSDAPANGIPPKE
jgi:ABC-type branched-subunit amino acid transport system substrate-binding protein